MLMIHILLHVLGSYPACGIQPVGIILLHRFTAICLYFIMGKKQSMMQCLGLLGLFSASVILSQAKAEVGGKVTSFQFG